MHVGLHPQSEKKRRDSRSILIFFHFFALVPSALEGVMIATYLFCSGPDDLRPAGADSWRDLRGPAGDPLPHQPLCGRHDLCGENANGVVGWSVGRRIGRLVGWSVGRLVGWSVGRFGEAKGGYMVRMES